MMNISDASETQTTEQCLGKVFSVLLEDSWYNSVSDATMAPLEIFFLIWPLIWDRLRESWWLCTFIFLIWFLFSVSQTWLMETWRWYYQLGVFFKELASSSEDWSSCHYWAIDCAWFLAVSSSQLPRFSLSSVLTSLFFSSSAPTEPSMAFLLPSLCSVQYLIMVNKLIQELLFSDYNDSSGMVSPKAVYHNWNNL